MNDDDEQAERNSDFLESLSGGNVSDKINQLDMPLDGSFNSQAEN